MWWEELKENQHKERMRENVHFITEYCIPYLGFTAATGAHGSRMPEIRIHTWKYKHILLLLKTEAFMNVYSCFKVRIIV